MRERETRNKRAAPLNFKTPVLVVVYYDITDSVNYTTDFDLHHNTNEASLFT